MYLQYFRIADNSEVIMFVGRIEMLSAAILWVGLLPVRPVFVFVAAAQVERGRLFAVPPPAELLRGS
jgi:hypothetical protein